MKCDRFQHFQKNFVWNIMYLNKESIEEIDRIKRLNIINSLSGIKTANLIGTKSNSGLPNVAIFSSVVHLGSNPALLGFILRPQSPELTFNTYANILENGFFTINHVPQEMVEQAHYTSAKFSKEESEFEKCGFTEEYIVGFHAPYVKESKLKIGLKFLQEIPIEINNTSLIIGQIEHLIFPEEIMEDEGYLDLEQISSAGVVGLNTYYGIKKLQSFPYARVKKIF